jgi:hypothetical protein
VFGIITAFQQMADPASGGGGGLATVSAGIAEALLTTAVGLGVAIGAVWFYNYFTTRLDDLGGIIDDAAGELTDRLVHKTRAGLGGSIAEAGHGGVSPPGAAYSAAYSAPIAAAPVAPAPVVATPAVVATPYVAAPPMGAQPVSNPPPLGYQASNPPPAPAYRASNPPASAPPPLPANWLEWQDWAHPILAEPFRLESGHLLVRDVPGAGLEWDEAAAQRYRMG